MSIHPAHAPLDEFDRITSDIPMVSPFRALWNEAEELLQATRPEGFMPEEIGRLAFEELSEYLPTERETALDELFYTFWVATVEARERRAAQTGGER